MILMFWNLHDLNMHPLSPITPCAFRGGATSMKIDSKLPLNAQCANPPGLPGSMPIIAGPDYRAILECLVLDHILAIE